MHKSNVKSPKLSGRGYHSQPNRHRRTECERCSGYDIGCPKNRLRLVTPYEPPKILMKSIEILAMSKN